MTVDDMTVHETSRTDVIPGPRTAWTAPGVAAGAVAWIEPWLFSRGTRPRTEYWDAETATWTSRYRVPAPLPGD
jgi:hypothetical protein